ncbi:transposase, partial [Xanthomonas fragariae]|uniref:transposase n=1 Tax=Xanthomonas fragariae TaxID=48664 RepID=UPI0025A16106
MAGPTFVRAERPGGRVDVEVVVSLLVERRLERLTKPLESCLAGGKIADMTRRKEIPIALWKRIEPLIPQVKRSPKGGRPRISDQQALNGIVYVLRTGVPWEDLPMELGYGSGMTCWRRLRDWQAAGVWHRLHQV